MHISDIWLNIKNFIFLTIVFEVNFMNKFHFEVQTMYIFKFK